MRRPRSAAMEMRAPQEKRMSQVAIAGIEAAYRAKFPNSERLYRQACEVFPNGVTHDGRYLRPFPIYIDRAQGSKKYDVDGNEIIDYWMGHGALLLGHSAPPVVDAVSRQAARGTHVGACHELEVEWGRWIQKLVPSVERV